jgi:Skp family chaperone for outer membrane proteins
MPFWKAGPLVAGPREDSSGRKTAMKSLSHPFAVAIAIVVLMRCGQAEGQSPARPALARVRIINLQQVIEKHHRFKQENDFLKKEIALRASRMSSLGIELSGLDERRGVLGKESREAREITLRMEHIQRELRGLREHGKHEIAERKAKILENVYRDVQDEVKLYSRYEGVSWVLTFNTGPVAGQEGLRAILEEIRQLLVRSQPGIDITDLIVTELNRPGTSCARPMPVNFPARPESSQPDVPEVRESIATTNPRE